MENNRVTLSQALEGYFIAAHARRLSPNTLSDYDNTFRRFETFLGIDPPLADITAADVRTFLNNFNHLSAKTLLNYHCALSSLWTWALRERLVQHHIVRDVQPPKPEKREILPYTEQEIRAMLAACDRSRPYTRPGQRQITHARPTAVRDRAIILLLLDTGMRASELCDLRLHHANLKSQQVLVMGKGRKERVLEFSSPTAQRLWRYLATRQDLRDTDPLFASLAGRPMSRMSLHSCLSRAGRRAGVPGVTVHRFRHTFAIQFLKNGGNVFALQRMLGHTTLDMVNRYLRIAQADVKEAHRIASPVTNWGL
jgi:site-specific recombinase XerD